MPHEIIREPYFRKHSNSRQFKACLLALCLNISYKFSIARHSFNLAGVGDLQNVTKGVVSMDPCVTRAWLGAAPLTRTSPKPVPSLSITVNRSTNLGALILQSRAASLMRSTSDLQCRDEDVQRYVEGHMLRQFCIKRNPDMQGKIKTEIVKAAGRVYLLI